MMNAVTLKLPVDEVSKKSSGGGQHRAENQEHSAACSWIEFPFIGMKDVDHDAPWLGLLNEVRQSGARADLCDD